MNLFVFFILPFATILLSIVLQKILKSPILVAIAFFAIYLIIAFVSFSDTLAEAIIAVLIYSIIAYITASIVRFIKCQNSFISVHNNLCNLNDEPETPPVVQTSDESEINNNVISQNFFPEDNLDIRRNNIRKRICRK